MRGSTRSSRTSGASRRRRRCSPESRRRYPQRPAAYRNFYQLNSSLLGSRSDDYEPVGFSHRIHDELDGGDCGVCHHRYASEANDRVGVDIRELHAQMDVKLGGPCSACHQDMENNPPQSCAAATACPTSPTIRRGSG